MTKVLAVTEFYNESENIPNLVKNMAEQTCVPDLWLIIDDGSSDNSTEIFEKNLRLYKIPYLLYQMPPKAKPSQNLKGRAFRKVDILNNEWVESDKFDYLVLTGGDSRFPPTYIELSTKVLDAFPNVGAMAGRIKGEPGSDTPMGAGKIVRWDVVKETSGLYWDLDPDSLWNVIALRMGYRLLILKDLLIWVTRPTHMYASSGFYNYGSRMYYVGWNPFLALFYSFVLAMRRTHPHHFLRGYLNEYVKSNWRCENIEIQRFYSFKRMIQRSIGAVPMRDQAIIVDIGIDKKNESELYPEFLEKVRNRIRRAIDV